MATPLLILYGSQTGNAQDVAEGIAREGRLLLFEPRVLPMDAYPVQSLPGEAAVVLVTSTTGQGDPPDNMRRFWRFLLRKSLAADSLAAVRYAVFGLGDSVYVKYNATAKKLDRRLAALGAKPLIERGLGDDQHPSGYDAALDPWLQQLWSALRAAFPLPPGVAAPPLDAAARLQLGAPKFRVTLLPAAANGAAAGSELANGSAADGPVADAPMAAGGSSSEQEQEEAWQREAVSAAAAFKAVSLEASGLPLDALGSGAAAAGGGGGGQQQQHGPWRPYMAPLVVNRRLTAPDHFQDTRHIEFNISGSGLSYEPGDVLAVFPRTPEADVQAMLKRLGLAAGQLIRIEAAAPPGGQPPSAAVVASARAIVQGILDVSGASPRRYLFQVLQHFAAAAHERERLAFFASPEGRDELYEYNQRERRTLLEVLSDFPSAAPLPLERLLEAAPLLQPRLYSISSSPLAHPGRAHITAAVVRYATPFKRPKRGLVTNWLASLVPPGGEAAAAGGGAAAEAAGGGGGGRPPRVPVWVERGCLRMPPLSVPLMLVGPGTGVAPFRSFLWQRAAIIKQQAAAAAGGGEAGGVSSGEGGGGAVAPCALFFGCRDARKDFYYSEEWAALQAAGVLGIIDLAMGGDDAAAATGGDAAAGDGVGVAGRGLGLVTAFSRPGGEGEKKAYVTDRIKQHGAQVWQLLSQRGGAVFISGSAQKMPADVAAAVESVAAAHGGLAQEAAAKWVRQLEAGGRWTVEAWS